MKHPNYQGYPGWLFIFPPSVLKTDIQLAPWLLIKVKKINLYLWSGCHQKKNGKNILRKFETPLAKLLTNFRRFSASKIWLTKNVHFFTQISPQNNLFRGSHTKFCWPPITSHKVKFFPFFGGIPYILKIGFVMDGPVLTEATVFSSTPDQITICDTTVLLELVSGWGTWVTSHHP